MARSDLLLSLVKAGTSGDQTLFRKVVESLIAEECGEEARRAGGASRRRTQTKW